MSSENPPQAENAPAPTIPVDMRLTFPPFPPVPGGVTLIPFTKFKERGIQLFATGENDGVERDGLGIPTVELRVQHDTDECKTETKRKSKRKAAQQARAAPGVRKEWWEAWMEGEDLRGPGSYNPHSSPIDRLYEAAGDFRKGRTWPPGAVNITQMWDQFRLFIGLLSNTPIWTRTDKPSQNDDSDSDDEAELEQEAATNVTTDPEPGPRRFNPMPRSRPPYTMYGKDPIPVGSDAEVRDLLDEEHARKEEKVVTFLNDPEDSIKVFLSSYMRKQGLIWHKPNLSNMPRLVGFFIRFLIRNRVFPESVHERSFIRCLEIVDRAQIDLPLTAQVANSLPDDFNESCKACWGTRADGYKPLSNPDAPQVEVDESADTDEPKSKKAKLDSDADKAPDPLESAKTAVEKFEEELKAANVEVIKIDDDTIMKEAILESIRDNADGMEINSTNDNNWGTWGSANEDNPAFTSKAEESDPWAEVIANWGPTKVQTLTAFLGPTALPLTHTTGVVEWSVRRVKALVPPPLPNTVQKSPVSNDEDADAVDIELERRLAKVVLEPWLGWDKAGDEMPHLSRPRILESSRGPVVSSADVAVDANARDTAAPAAGADEVKPHDPATDEITVFVEPKVLESLSVGLGIGATWVQMAREQDFADGALKRKKKKSKSKKAPQRYWYVEEVILVLPSYHT